VTRRVPRPIWHLSRRCGASKRLGLRLSGEAPIVLTYHDINPYTALDRTGYVVRPRRSRRSCGMLHEAATGPLTPSQFAG